MITARKVAYRILVALKRHQLGVRAPCAAGGVDGAWLKRGGGERWCGGGRGYPHHTSHHAPVEGFVRSEVA